MSHLNPLRAALVGVAASMATAPAWAGANDYAFEAVTSEVANGAGSILAVRLIHKPDGKPVDGAIVFRTRLDMSPEKMEGMTTDVVAESATEPGVYRFRGNLTMAGNWALKLMAKVQGEIETVSGAVIFTAK